MKRVSSASCKCSLSRRRSKYASKVLVLFTIACCDSCDGIGTYDSSAVEVKDANMYGRGNYAVRKQVQRLPCVVVLCC